MGQVEAGHRPGRVRQPRHLGQVEGLPGAVLDAGPQHQRQAMAVHGDGRLQRRHRDGAFGLVRLQLDQVGGRVEAMEADLRLDRMPVGGKRAGLDQDRRALARGPVEADHHEVQVGGEGVHRHHLAGQRADHARQRLAHLLVVGHPLALAAEVALHRLVRPLVQHLFDRLARALGLQAERVAAEVHLFGVLVPGDQEFLAEAAQRICGVQGDGVRAGVGHGSLGT